MFHVKQSDGLTIATVEQFAEYSAERGCVLSSIQVERLGVLTEWLVDRAPALGLSRYRDIPAVLTAALAPTLALFELIDVTEMYRVMDLGAGSGALGFILALTQPHLAVTLMDRRAKAATFLELTAQHVGIGNAQVIRGDAREVQAVHAGRYNLVCFRAVAEGATALGLAYPFLGSEGYIAAWHQTGDDSFQCPVLGLSRRGTAQTVVRGLVVSVYSRAAER